MSDIGKRLAPNGKKPKSPRKGKLTRQQIILIVVVVVLAIALAVTLALRSLFVRPELPVRNDPQNTVDKDGDGKPDGPEPIDYGEGLRPRGGDGERKSKDYWTVLVLGRDTGGGGNTDTMLLASYDVTNQKATVMSIPRDTMVNVPWDIKRINSVYNYYGGGERGIQHLYKEISQLVGFEPDFQVVVEWDAVGEIVDAIGGVYFDVPQDMNYDDPYQDLHIHQTAGYRLLSGDDAMQVLRYRHDNRKNGVTRGYPDGDLGRIKTQQAFLKAMVDQLLRPKNMTKVGPLIEAFNKNVETDMSFQNILWFGQQAVMGGLKTEDVNFVTMPNRAKYAYSRSVGNMQSYVVPNAKELLDLVNNELSPFTEVFTMKDLDIMSVNADGSVSSSTGYVEDKKAALPPPKDEPEEEEPAVDENGYPIDPETGLPITVDPETGEPIVPIDPETGEPLVTGPPDTAIGSGENGGGTTDSNGSAQPGGTAPAGPPDGGTPAPPAPETPNTVPDPAPADPEPPAPAEPAPEVPADPQLPADPGFTLIGPDPAA
ncbi:LCP family protein [uncultured Oscillibacter sp.]|uniref:LCP family protein n=1 Tax=uncultured Oscillibacter sp. TaxID=876091 RepID=UPI002729C8BA|nr:LCP family protein [uncultured Oscillibacter sp.]